MIERKPAMTINAISSSLNADLDDEATWNNLYSTLHPLVSSLVYSLHVPSWYGQEEDLIDDIIQETMRRAIERLQKAKCGAATPIRSLQYMMIVIAQNYCRDLRRKDCRVSHHLFTGYIVENDIYGEVCSSPLEIATENVYQELIFAALAHEVARFPMKQRNALLIDLANHMYFDAQPTSLQKAFLQEGIQLRQYRQLLPTNRLEKNRHVSLLNSAYRRIAHLFCIEDYAVE
jgi:DNA-directed RNA polymerase specialized sigma24 family protein